MECTKSNHMDLYVRWYSFHWLNARWCLYSRQLGTRDNENDIFGFLSFPPSFLLIPSIKGKCTFTFRVSPIAFQLMLDIIWTNTFSNRLFSLRLCIILHWTCSKSMLLSLCMYSNVSLNISFLYICHIIILLL